MESELTQIEALVILNERYTTQIDFLQEEVRKNKLKIKQLIEKGRID
jgi:hypothetical protein